MRHKFVFGAGALVLGLCSHAMAGVVITSTQTKLDTHEAGPVTVYVDSDRLKVESGGNIVIFRGDLNRLWVIDPARHSYMEMTPETMQRMSGQLAGAQAQLGAAGAQLQERLAQMPPEQRAMMAQMLASRGVTLPDAGPAAQSAPAQAVFAKAGGGKTVAGWSCENYTKTVNGQQQEQVCIARAASAGLTASDFQVMDKIAAFVAPVSSSPMVPRMDYMNWNEMNKAIGFQGLPVDTTIFLQGRPLTQTVLTKIDHAAIPANTFDLPQGFTKREMGMPPR
ncbi:MAG TPA: DUF4412 domain-containing protein [Micropepsaceae bacterium]|nr:DUF4412 domain-containing protein [Micropepsaceae bacterium]